MNSNLNTSNKHYGRYVIFLLYLAGSFILLLNHELWKDEAHHWLLARDSHSLSNLFYNARYEGHPLLWNSLMYLVSLFTHDPFYVQLLHWALGASAIWLLVFKSPFPAWISYMLPFTYLLLYEYQVISRNYAICVLLLFVVSHVLCQDKVKYTSLAIYLVLLANAHLFGLIIAGSICLVLVINHIDIASRKFNFKPLTVLLIICSVGFALSIYQIIPPSDHFLTTQHNNAGLLSGTRINKLLSVFYRGVFHIPNLGEPSVWNSNLIFSYIPDIAKVAVSLAVWVLPFLFFREHKKLLFLFFFCSLSIAFFAYISPLLLSVRHSGFVFILLISCFWLTYSKSFKTVNAPEILIRYSRIIFGILTINIVSSLLIAYVEFSRPFSMSQEANHYIKEQQLNHLPIASTQNTGPSLSAYLEQPLFYMDKGEMGSYAVWSNDSFVFEKAIIDQNLKNYAQSQQDFIIASEFNYNADFLGACWQFDKLKSFQGSIVRSEQFELYRVTRLCD